jgi:hypothetical protein
MECAVNMNHGLPSVVICRGYLGVCRGVLGMDIMSEKYALIKELRLVHIRESLEWFCKSVLSMQILEETKIRITYNRRANSQWLNVSVCRLRVIEYAESW